jgi:hypothetical protein
MENKSLEVPFYTQLDSTNSSSSNAVYLEIRHAFRASSVFKGLMMTIFSSYITGRKAISR